MNTEQNLRVGQRGLALGDLLTWCIIIGVAALGIMRVFPIYNEKLKVDTTIKNIVENAEVNQKSSSEIAKAMLRNFEVQDVDQFTNANIKDVLKIEKINGSKERRLTFEYEIRGPLFGKFEIVYQYQQEAVIPGLGYN